MPDHFFDSVLGSMDNIAKLEVVLYVLRRTVGSGKFVERISEDEFMDAIRKGRK